MAHSRRENTLHHLANTVRRAGLTSKVTIIAKAKVPIIKFVTDQAYGAFNVDMSVNQPNGIVAGEVVNRFLESWERGGRGEGRALRSLVMITKLFLSQRGMNEVFTGGLGSYTIVCLAISFLQLHPKIRRGEVDPEKNLGVLLVEFLELYGWAFNYEEVGISIRDGGRYFGKMERGWGEMDWKKRGLLSVEDPVDPCELCLLDLCR
jgi:non-canonical poly(A) RNA polymerase PAPD5/7